MQGAAAFIAVNRTQLGIANRQLPITAELGFVDQYMEWTIHRFDHIILPIYIHRRIHAFAVEIPMPAGFPDIEVSNMRGIEQIVTILEMFVFPKIFDDLANQGSLGMPENQSRTSLFMETEQVQLLAYFAVVTLFGFFQQS
jgi:hypothetical protein